MSAGYVIARENFKEAGRHVSAEADPVMFNLLYGLQSLTNQIEADFAALRALGGGAARVSSQKAACQNRSTPEQPRTQEPQEGAARALELLRKSTSLERGVGNEAMRGSKL
jgi:hypothetical protein